MSRRAARCKSCNARILWTVTDGARVMPVDHDPAHDGNIAIWPASDEKGRKVWRSRLVGPQDPMPQEVIDTRPPGRRASEPERVLRLSHFVTCPNAARHRR